MRAITTFLFLTPTGLNAVVTACAALGAGIGMYIMGPLNFLVSDIGMAVAGLWVAFSMLFFIAAGMEDVMKVNAEKVKVQKVEEEEAIGAQNKTRFFKL